MCGPYWVVLRTYGSHDMRHIDFPRVDGGQRDTRFWGVTDSTQECGVILKIERFSHLSNRSFGLNSPIELEALSLMLSVRPEKIQFSQKSKIVISVKNPKFIL